MPGLRIVRGFLAASGITVCAWAGDLSDDQRKLLIDPQGWEYLFLFDIDNGVTMQHQCFVEGQQGAGGCKGTLLLREEGTFDQNVYAHGGVLNRHGTYSLDGDQLTLKDELGTKDGPYTVEIDQEQKMMKISMRQTGVLVGAKLELESERNRRKQQKKQAADPKP